MKRTMQSWTATEWQTFILYGVLLVVATGAGVYSAYTFWSWLLSDVVYVILAPYA